MSADEPREPEELFVRCRRCASSADRRVRRRSGRLFVRISVDRVHVEAICPTHGLVTRFELDRRYEASCDLCEKGIPHRH